MAATDPLEGMVHPSPLALEELIAVPSALRRDRGPDGPYESCGYRKCTHSCLLKLTVHQQYRKNPLVSLQLSSQTHCDHRPSRSGKPVELTRSCATAGKRVSVGAGGARRRYRKKSAEAYSDQRHGAKAARANQKVPEY